MIYSVYHQHIHRERKTWIIQLLIFAMFLILIPSTLYSQTISRVGSTAATFLKVGIGARALAMGDAYTTLAEDVLGVYWNPGAMATIEKMQATYSHYQYIADVRYDFGACAIPMPNIGTIGAFLGYMNYGEIERTTIQFPDGDGERVTASSFVVGFSYTRSLTDRFSIGGNIKYIYEGIWHSTASAYAADVGLLYKTFFKNIRIGMSISNFGSSMKMDGRDMSVQHDITSAVAGNNPNIPAHLDTDTYPLPLLFRVGLSSNITRDLLDMTETDWILAIDVIHPNDNKEYLNIGTEVAFLNHLFSLRGGYRQVFLEHREGGLTLGGGVSLDISNSSIALDYAMIDYGRLGNKNVITLVISY